MSPHPAIALPFDRPFTAPEAYAAGLTARALRHRVGAGQLVRLRRGVYAPARDLTPRERIDSAMLTAPAGAVLGFEAAAVLLGMPIPHSGGLQRIDLYVPEGTPPSGGRPVPEVRVHHVTLPPLQVAQVGSWPVTSLGRTAVDLARGQRRVERALITLDHARRRGVTLRDLYDARYAVSGLRGAALLDEALRECTPLAESPFESLSRGVMLRFGLPRPVLQQPLVGASGATYRADFYYPEARLVLEADGASKYLRDDDVAAFPGAPAGAAASRAGLASAGATASRGPAASVGGATSRAQVSTAPLQVDLGVFMREKVREDDLRAADYRFARWTWDELVRNPEAVMARIRAKL